MIDFKMHERTCVHFIFMWLEIGYNTSPKRVSEEELVLAVLCWLATDAILCFPACFHCSETISSKHLHTLHKL
jgi:hypothetical protein